MSKNKIIPLSNNITDKCKYLIELSLNQDINIDNNSNSSNQIILFTPQKYSIPIVQTMIETNNNIEPITILYNKFNHNYISNNFCSKSENNKCCCDCCLLY